jgi:hypothetical protein
MSSLWLNNSATRHRADPPAGGTTLRQSIEFQTLAAYGPPSSSMTVSGLCRIMSQ